MKINCSECGNEFEKEKREIVRQNKKGRFKFYCCKACQILGVSKSGTIHKPEIKKCLNCDKEFESSTHCQAKTCCSKTCAANYSKSFYTEESRIKVSLKIKEKWEDGTFDKLKTKEVFNKFCEKCGEPFSTKRKGRKYCSNSCSISGRQKSTGIIEYRNKCKFNFSLNDFPEEFDFSLIRENGWYSASNRGNNLGGVSRDHMVSVKFGFENNIDPKIIAHPANCRLLKHNENFKKLDKCSILLEDLLVKIKEWDLKYSHSI